MIDLKELFTAIKPDPKNDLLITINFLINKVEDCSDRLTASELKSFNDILESLIKIYKSK